MKLNLYNQGGMVNPLVGSAVEGVGSLMQQSNDPVLGALGGAAKGAASGAMFGPIGMGVGALVGGVTSIVQGNKQRKAEAAMQDAMRQQQVKSHLSKLSSSEGVQQGAVNPYNIMAYGGLTQNQLETYDNGGTHSQNPNGGIQIGADQNGTPNMVEEGETSFNFSDGKYVFSDRLPVPNISTLPKNVSGKTYSEASDYIEKLFKGRNSAIDNSTKKTMMRRLRDSQEALKQEMNPKQQNQQQNQFAYGGGINDGNTGIYGDSLTPVDINEKINLNESDLTEAFSDYDETSKYNDFNSYDYDLNTINQKSDQNMLTDKLNNIKSNSPLTTVAGLAGMTAPLFSNMAMENKLTRPEKTQARTIQEELTPELVNTQQVQRNLVKQLAGNRQALASKSSGDFGQYAANLQSMHSGSANALANAQLQSELANAQERSKVKQANIGLDQFNISQQSQADERYAQDLAAYENQKMAFTRAKGENIANIGKTLFNYGQSKDYTSEMAKALKLLGLQGKNSSK